MITGAKYDIAITGGGLAGLSLAIQCARAGYNTVLFEKERYPFHRVCGEYVSFESWNFLQDLGIPLSDMQLPHIKRLQLSAPGGQVLEQDMPLGGFGISRYLLDAQLAQIAQAEGVTLLEGTQVNSIVYQKNEFLLSGAFGTVTAIVATGAFGKRSNLDIRWKRPFISRPPGKLNHYVGVKYHIRYPLPTDLIGLHYFDQGYCSISPIENDQYCLCYLTRAANLQNHQKDVRLMEKNVLFRNPFLEKIFSEAEFLYKKPLTIARISFNQKEQVFNHILLAGDAAGMVPPLCGNGMSMALRGSKIAFEQINAFLQGDIDRYEMELQYTQQWEQQFARRLQTGRLLQRFMGNKLLTMLLVAAVRPFPAIVTYLMRQTHGEPF